MKADIIHVTFWQTCLQDTLLIIPLPPYDCRHAGWKVGATWLEPLQPSRTVRRWQESGHDTATRQKELDSLHLRHQALPGPISPALPLCEREK